MRLARREFACLLRGLCGLGQEKNPQGPWSSNSLFLTQYQSIRLQGEYATNLVAFKIYDRNSRISIEASQNLSARDLQVPGTGTESYALNVRNGMLAAELNEIGAIGKPKRRGVWRTRRGILPKRPCIIRADALPSFYSWICECAGVDGHRLPLTTAFKAGIGVDARGGTRRSGLSNGLRQMPLSDLNHGIARSRTAGNHEDKSDAVGCSADR